MKRALVVAGMIGCGPATTVVKEAAPAAQAQPLGEALPVTVFADGEAEVSELAVDGDDVYWLAGAALRRSRGGAVETIADPVDWFAVDHGEVFVLSDEQVQALDGAVLATIPRAERILVSGKTIYVSADSPPMEKVAQDAGPGRIFAVPRAGGAATEQVTGAGAVIAMASDGDALYWADGGDHGFEPVPERCADPARKGTPHCTPRASRYGAIRRVRDGTQTTIADGVYYPIAIGVDGDHVYWSAANGEALLRAPGGGGDAVVGLGGRGVAMAVDAAGAVVVTESGYVIEVPANGGAARVRAVDLEPRYGGVAVALAADAIYVADHEREQIRRYPRGSARVTVLATAHGNFKDVALGGDSIYALDIDASEGRADRVLKIPRRGGHGEVVGTYGTMGAHVAVADGQVVVLEYERIFAGGASIDLEDRAIDVATDGRDVYWLSADGGVVSATPIGADQRRQVYKATRNILIAMRLPTGRLAVDGDALYVAGENVGELARVRDGVAETIAPHVDDFAVHGDLVVTLGEDGLVARPSGTVLAPPESELGSIAVDARDAWAIREGDEAPQLVRFPLDGGDEEVVIDPVWAWIAAADDDALYLAGGELLLRLATRP